VVFLARSKPQHESASSPLLGRVAPALTGTTLEGGTFDLSAERGRFVVVNFFASWCEPCQSEAPELRRWAERHEATGDAVLVNVLFQDTPAAARTFFSRYGGVSWPVLAVDTDTMGLDWGVAKVPETLVVDPNGIVVVKTISEVDEATLDGFLRRYAPAATTTLVPTTTATTTPSSGAATSSVTAPTETSVP
jgi:cytochrome c biogenesis protein CcmG/thiol:disulfide interchange protein DsbE